MFDRAEFARMADVLAGIRGRFILSLNDTPEVREMFARFATEPVGTHYGVSGHGMQVARELIITDGDKDSAAVEQGPRRGRQG